MTLGQYWQETCTEKDAIIKRLRYDAIVTRKNLQRSSIVQSLRNNVFANVIAKIF